MMGVLIHVMGDAMNNIGVIIASTVIWKAKYEGRYYADPAVSMGIAIMILLSSIPLGKLPPFPPLHPHLQPPTTPQNRVNLHYTVKNAGSILLESVPLGVSLEDVKHDLENISGVLSIHELHAWRLSQNKALASAHVLTSSNSLSDFMIQAKHINECLHAYGIHSSTLQPELVSGTSPPSAPIRISAVGNGEETRRRASRSTSSVNGFNSNCRINCGTSCEELTCCG